MGYSKKTYQIANDRIFQRRQQAEKNAELLKKDIFSKLPRVEQIFTEISSCGVSAAKAVIKGGNVKDEIEKLKSKSLSLQNELSSLLTSNGYSKDCLLPHYLCQKCNDTGYYEENNKTLVCPCFKSLLSDIACEELNAVSPLKLCTFSSFDLDYYSMDVEGEQTSPYSRMSKIFNYCKKYADSFSPLSSGIIMRGATGLGKTHLSLAIANEVIKKGFSVIYVSAPSLMSKLEKEHFSGRKISENQTESAVLDCDLLIIDDIGTEFVTSFSTSAFYNIFNSRILQNKPVILNTNLTLSELESTYSQRFVSRIMGYCSKLDFIGSDIRPRLRA